MYLLEIKYLFSLCNNKRILEGVKFIKKFIINIKYINNKQNKFF